MKKLLLTLIVAACTMGFVSAQDLGQVTEMYNAAAVLLNEGNKADALAKFEQALEAANAIEKIKKGGTTSSVDEGMRLKDL